jgi:16S rRNA (uracil1498-N3)-methyltransferase
MITPRLYVGDDPGAPVPGGEYALPEAAARHVGHVLRMRVGDPVALFTGTGGEYVGTIRGIDRRAVALQIDRHDPVERETPWPVTLAQSIIAADMMDFIIRKAVELGVAAIQPLQSARSQHASDDRITRRLAHWRRVAIAACEQCGRNRIPAIAPVVSFAQWLATIDDASRPVALLDAGGERSLASLGGNMAPRIIVVGPEGGFDGAEVRLAHAAGAMPVHLGARVLRAETAALAALASVNAIAGDAR